MKNLSVLFLLVMHIADVPAQADSLVWRQALPEELSWSRITFAGTLLVASENQLSHYSSVDGRRMWLRADLAGLSQFNVQDVPGSPLLVVNQHVGTRPDQFRLLILNVMSGETVWDAGVSGGKALGVFPVPAENLLVFAVELPEVNGSESGTYLLSYALESGEELWRTRIGRRKDLPLHTSDRSVSKTKDLSGHPQPVIIGSSFILVAGDLIAIDLESGIEEWRFPLKASVRKLKNTYAQPLLVDGVLYAAGRSRVYAIDPNNGAEIWRSKIGRSAMPQLEAFGDLLVGRMGGTFSDGEELLGNSPYGAFAIERSSGKLKWKWTKAKDSITNLHVMPEEGITLLADKKRLYALELNPAKKAKLVYREDLEFKRKLGGADVAAKGIGVVGGLLGGGPIRIGGGADRADPPLDIEAYGDRLIVRAQYHVLSFDLKSHATDWSIEFEPPGVSGLSLIAMGAITATMVASNANRPGGGYSNSSALPTSAMSSQFEEAVAARYAVSEKARDVAFFLTRKDKSLSLVGIDLNDGSVVGTIAMADREPQFLVDAIAGRAYYYKDSVELLAYDF